MYSEYALKNWFGVGLCFIDSTVLCHTTSNLTISMKSVTIKFIYNIVVLAIFNRNRPRFGIAVIINSQVVNYFVGVSIQL